MGCDVISLRVTENRGSAHAGSGLTCPATAHCVYGRVAFVSEPDVLHGDGVYSRYFTEFGLAAAAGGQEQLLGVRVTVGGSKGRVVTGRPPQLMPRAVPVDGSPPCCGSTIGEVTSVPVSDLRREVAGGTVNVILPPAGRDLLPPSRVTDLRTEVDAAKQTITFNWTAPGDDFDKPNTRGKHCF